jgi:small neutral amino acid transporter SnatA (MarC family)
MSMVASPLCIPLMLTPTGIVALITLSGEAVKIVDGLIIAGMIAGIMMFNLFALNISGSFAKYLSKSLIDLMERVLGVLLAALAVQLILNGLADLGIITLTSH